MSGITASVPMDVRPEHILDVLREAKTPLRAMQVAKQLQRNGSVVARLLRQLHAAGAVVGTPNAGYSLPPPPAPPQPESLEAFLAPVPLEDRVRRALDTLAGPHWLEEVAERADASQGEVRALLVRWLDTGEVAYLHGRWALPERARG